MVTVAINQLKCGRDADSGREAEPYLWNIFFKIDGNTVDVDFGPAPDGDSILVSLDGHAEFHFSSGSHGNLGDGVATGGSLAIPSAVGTWDTPVEPIVVNVLFDEVELPGTVGVIPILLEEDNVSDDGAEAGHRRLNELVEQKLNELIRSFEVEVPRDDLANAETIVAEAVEAHFEAGARDLEDEIATEVADAIKTEQGFFENLWSGVNKDDTIGSHVWRVSDADVADRGGSFPLSHTWDNEFGEWTISGAVTDDADDDAPARIPIGDFDLDLGEYRLPEGYDFGLSDYLGRVAEALDGKRLVPEGFMMDNDAVLDIREVRGRTFGGAVQLDLSVALYPDDGTRLDLSTIQVLQSAPTSTRFGYGGGSRGGANGSHYAVLADGDDAVLNSEDDRATVVVEPKTDSGTVRLAFADSATDLWRYVEIEVPETLGSSPQVLDWHRVVN